ncbi:MAG: hypothetical protein WCJ25_03430 [Candidatus Moraniibacteriota bacterium]
MIRFKNDVTPCEVACSEDFEEMRKLMKAVRVLPIFCTEISAKGKTKTVVVYLDVVAPTIGRTLHIAFENGIWARIEPWNDGHPYYLKNVHEGIFGFEGPGTEVLRKLIRLNEIIENGQRWMRWMSE